MNGLRLPLLLPLLVALFAFAACGRDFTPLADAPAPPPAVADLPPITLPADHRPHDNLTEWWYFTGHLEDDRGDEYGFEFVIFQGVRGDEGGYAAHFAVTAGSAGFSYAQRTSYSDGFQVGAGLELCVGGWTLAEAGGVLTISAAMPGYELNLDLVPRKPAALNNRDGLLDFSPYGWSYYYSFTRLDLGGRLTTGDGPAAVAGEAWMDHQWGDFISVGSGGWDWFSLQLKDGRDFTASVVRGDDGAVVLEYGTLIAADGATRHLEAGEFAIEALDEWTSPATGAVYPSGWRLTIPDDAIDVELQPVLADQELDVRASTGNIYWEGAVRALAGDRPVGRGYVELTGYADAVALSFEVFDVERVDLCEGFAATPPR